MSAVLFDCTWPTGSFDLTDNMARPGRNGTARTMLWWGRFDPDYARNRILRRCLRQSAWHITDFSPSFSLTAAWEARWRAFENVDVVWVPCFRQRDIGSASGWCRQRGLPLFFDPLISAFDKQVNERAKFAPGSAKAQRLLAWEQKLFALADRIIADTQAHADYFIDTLRIPADRIRVVPVGADEGVFTPQPAAAPGDRVEVLFYGSFVTLQGAEVIVEAASRCQGSRARWCLLGDGPTRAAAERSAAGLDNVCFEPWISYENLPARIAAAHIVLGIFGSTEKTQRVIPNKVYQALACGRPVVTAATPAFPAALLDATDSGISWVPAGDAQALADAVIALTDAAESLTQVGTNSRRSYERYFSESEVASALDQTLAFDRAANTPENLAGA